MSVLVNFVLLVLALPALLASLYLLLFTLLSRKPLLPLQSSRRLYFDIIVPAHNEAAVIAGVVSSLRQLDWPADRFRILVVADNCTDDTAIRARTAGAVVLTSRVSIDMVQKVAALGVPMLIAVSAPTAHAVP